MARRRTLFILLVSLQLLSLLGVALYREFWRSRGPKILLNGGPVPLHDLMRGRRISLSYGISSLNADQLPPGEAFRRNDPVYVTLGRAQGGDWQPLAFSRRPPEGVVFMAGRAVGEPTIVAGWDVLLALDDGTTRTLRPTWFDFREGDRVFACIDRRGITRHMDRVGGSSSCWDKEWTMISGSVAAARQTSSRRLAVEYGIEDYLVEVGAEGGDGKGRASGDLQVEVSLRPDGRALISRLLLDGREIR